MPWACKTDSYTCSTLVHRFTAPPKYSQVAQALPELFLTCSLDARLYFAMRESKPLVPHYFGASGTFHVNAPKSVYGTARDACLAVQDGRLAGRRPFSSGMACDCTYETRVIHYKQQSAFPLTPCATWQ